MCEANPGAGMSSTNFSVGLQDGRNSSRVLKPPGGGHSQIFGGQGETDKPRPKSKATSSIGECFSHAKNEKKVIMDHCEKVEIQTIETIETVGKTENVAVNENVEIIENIGMNENIEKTLSLSIDENKEANGVELNGNADKINGNTNGDKAAPATTPQRVRVPPGGFSSGFW